LLKEQLQDHGHFVPHLELLVEQVVLSMQHCGNAQLRSAECFSLVELLLRLVLEHGWCGLGQAKDKHIAIQLDRGRELKMMKSVTISNKHQHQ
jgi:hypothetical protein